jgi:serine/threonine protein kinase
MRLFRELSGLALGPLVATACEAVGVGGAEHAARGAASLLLRHFSDNSQRLGRALDHACAHAWKALEIALAGDSFWERCRARLASGDNRAFRDQLRAFLDAVPEGSLPLPSDTFRRYCLAELRAARKAGLLTAEADDAELAEGAAAFAGFQDPERLLQAQKSALGRMAEELEQAGYDNLARLLNPPGGPPLLLVAARYFLRRAVEDDPQLAAGLAFERMERLQERQTQGFEALGHLLSEQGERLESLLSELQEAVEETHAAVLDVHEELRAQGAAHRELYRAVLELQRRLDLARTEVRPRDSLSIRDDTERRLVRQVVERYRKLPQQERQQAPALLNAIGQLEVAAGDFRTAEQDFAAVAGMVEEPQARAAAHANACRAALEARDWDRAFREMASAIRVGGPSYAPFPLTKYQPERILGAGGFGVAFLCQHKFLDMRVVVKTLLDEALDCRVEQMFAEAEVLRQLNAPGIVRIIDHGYTDPAKRSRPYLAVDDFDGVTLEEHVQKHGALDLRQWLTVARQMAKALLAAHQKGILHRDVKPANVLVRQEDEGPRALLIDFGLALRQESLKSATGSGKTLFASSIAGTIDYAAPEQIGRLPGVKVGPYSDVYGFGKTCCFALFGTAQPVLRHWQSIPEPLADLLSRCLGEKPQERPKDFEVVLRSLDLVQRQLKIGPLQPLALAIERDREEAAQAQPAARPQPQPRPRPAPQEAPRRSQLLPRETSPRSTPSSPRPVRRESAIDWKEGLTRVPPWAWAALGGGALFVTLAGILVLAILLQRGWSGLQARGGGSSVPSGPYPTPAVSDPEERRVYLSDLRELEVGPFPFTWSFGKHGEMHGASTPPRFTVNGHTSPKGLCLHPPENAHTFVRYRIPPSEVFQAVVGLADTGKEKLPGDAFFEVYGDGRRLWRSDPVTGRGAFQDCRVSVKGVRDLELRVSPPKGASGHDHCHAVWIDPYLVRAEGAEADKAPAPEDKPLPADMPSVLPWKGNELYLADVKETSVSGLPLAWGLGRYDNEGFGGPIKVNGKAYHYGLGTHPGGPSGARVSFQLAREVDSLRTEVAISESDRNPASLVTFEVVGDGRSLWKSKPLGKGETEKCKVSLKGVRELEMRALCSGDITGCHAVWLDPVLHRAAAKK